LYGAIENRRAERGLQMRRARYGEVSGDLAGGGGGGVDGEWLEWGIGGGEWVGKNK
jgi:hypothetical protein